MSLIKQRLQKLKEGIAELEKFESEISNSFVKVGHPVIYDNKIALVNGFTYDRETQKTKVAIIFVETDGNGDSSSNYSYYWSYVDAKVDIDKLAPYTDNAKILFAKDK